MSTGNTLYDIFGEDDLDIVSQDKTSIKALFSRYNDIVNPVYHSPNMSPSEPINNGIVSE